METEMTSPYLEKLLGEYNTLKEESNPANRHVYASHVTQAITDRIQQLELLIGLERLRLQAEQDAAAEAAAAAEESAELSEQAQMLADLDQPITAADVLPVAGNDTAPSNTLPAEAIAALSDENPPA